MTKGQRKMHLVLWLLLAILLPAGFIASIMVIPNQSMQENVFLPEKVKLEKLLKETSSNNVIALLRSNNQHSQYQLEVLVTTPFKTPDIGVYLSNKADFNITDSHFLGNLPSKGGKLFDLPEISQNDKELQVVLFDPIRNQLLNQISIKL